MTEQQLLPDFEPTERDLVERALAIPYEQKVDILIKNIQLYKPSIARDSGGKDSGVVIWAMNRSGVDYRATYSDTTIDPPELQDFLKTARPETEWLDAGRGHLILDRMVEKMNMPTRHGKWCCSEYKNCCNGGACAVDVKCVGVRAAESRRRAALWKLFTHVNGERILAPFVYWTDEDVWTLIRNENIPYCSLYDDGMDRIGCVGCPIPGEETQRKEFARWPEIEAMWREGARLCWEKGQKVMNRSGEKYYVAKFSSPEALFDWWLTGQKEEIEANCVFEEMMENT